MRTLVSIAQFENPERCVVHLRSARVGETLIIDIGDKTGRAIEITAQAGVCFPRTGENSNVCR